MNIQDARNSIDKMGITFNEGNLFKFVKKWRPRFSWIVS